MALSPLNPPESSPEQQQTQEPQAAASPASEPPVSPELEVQASEPQPEVSPAASPEPETKERVPQDEDLKVPEWTSWADVKLDEVPDIARPWAEKLMSVATSHITGEQERLQKAADGYNQSRTALNEMMSRIDSSAEKGEAVGKELLAQRGEFEGLVTQHQQLQEQYVKMVWGAFEAKNPDLEALPPQTREEFAIQLEQGIDRFTGATPLERMEEALAFAKFKTGVGTATAQTYGIKQDDHGVGAKQAMVANGRTAPVTPKPDIDSQTMDDILNAHDDILKEVFGNRMM